MGWNEMIGDCCRSLGTANLMPSDKHLAHFVHLQRIAEDISIVFNYNSLSRQAPGISTQGIELSVKAFKSQLDAAWHMLPADTACLCKYSSALARNKTSEIHAMTASIILAYKNLFIHLYEVCLMIQEEAEGSCNPLVQDLKRLPTVRTRLLLDCLEATKAFLDQYLQLSTREIMSHSILEKGQLAHALVILMKLAFAPNPSLDSRSWRQACKVDHYLTALGNHVGRVGTDSEIHDSFWYFKEIAHQLKCWYQRMEFSEISDSPSELKGMSPLQLVEIVREESSFNIEITSMDFNGMDFLFLPGANFWE